MTGELIPLVLIPRFTGLVGAQEFATVPIDVTPYLGGSVTLWRGPLVGSSPTFTVFFEVADDTGATWFKIPPTSEGQAGYSPNAGDAGALTIPLPFSRRWFRALVVLGGSDPAVTCWCAGNVEVRLD